MSHSETAPADPALSPPVFCCVNDGVPDETISLLRAACEARGVEYLELDAPSFAYEPNQCLRPGDLLFRPAVSGVATRVEQFLYHPQVATFYSRPEDAFFECANWPLFLARSGVPLPRMIPCASASRTLLKDVTARLGGFPLIVKVLGGSSGIGTMRLDSFPALFSVMDFLLAKGHSAYLAAYVADAIHWRVVVVGTEAVAAYQNVPQTDDFRTYADQRPERYTQDVRPDLAEVALLAVHALHLEHGGVDILEHASGRLYVLEVNFPCYFPEAQLAVGIDVAGAMLNHLMKKAEWLKHAE